tara:strand:+ start:119 stop:436 length:318 start_codon:yes stop_codon:yes gene_type:complete
MEAIQVEIGHKLIQYVTESNNQPSFELVNGIQHLRKELHINLNFRVPPIRICDNSNLFPRQIRIYVHEKIVVDEQLEEQYGSTELWDILAEQINCLANESFALAI